MAEKILEIERQGEEVILRFRKPDLHVPEDTKSHLRVARKETLLAIRSLIDMAIERAEEEEKGKGKGKKRTKIEVQ